MPMMAMPPIQGSVTWWKWRQSRPAGCSMVQAFWSGSVQRPSICLSSRSSCSSLTALAVGLTEVGCGAPPGAAQATMNASASAPAAKRMRMRSVPIPLPPCSP